MQANRRTRAPSAVDSGATGGPATAKGVAYQLDYATYLCLDRIAVMLTQNPTFRPFIVVEPRLAGDDSVTRWDIRTEPDNVAFEAKLNPTANDVLNWIDQVVFASARSPQLTFELTIGDRSCGCLKGLEKAIRIATEEPNDPRRFDLLCAIAADKNLDTVRVRLGTNALAVVKRMRVRVISPDALADQIQFCLRYLVPPAHSDSVREYLSARLLRAMSQREVIFVPEVLRDLGQRSIRFHSPTSVLPTDLDPELHRAVFLLQQCPTGLPTEVVAPICTDGRPGGIESIIAAAPHALIVQREIIACSPLPARLTHPDAAQLLGKTLRALLAFIKANRHSAEISAQIDNAIVLGELCLRLAPCAVVELFDPLDKLLKRRGRKRDVLKVADLTIDAARSIPIRDEFVVHAEAKALVCGRSWALQRVGEIGKAEAFARESLALGESIGWVRNTAFCLKCLGRLKRVEAEQSPNARRRPALLNESLTLLRRAVQTFSDCDEFGPESEEVGDCHSLMGRTLLALKNTAAARKSAKSARDLIIDHSSKDFMDLLILEGEIAAEGLDYDTANKKFKEALQHVPTDDAEKSEIAARAHLCRGLNLKAWTNDTDGARTEIRAAREIWDRLGEDYSRGVADWHLAELDDDVPKHIRRQLMALTPSVASEAVRLARSAASPQSSKTLSQRAQLTDQGWKQMIAQAKKNDAVRHRHWT